MEDLLHKNSDVSDKLNENLTQVSEDAGLVANITNQLAAKKEESEIFERAKATVKVWPVKLFDDGLVISFDFMCNLTHY